MQRTKSLAGWDRISLDLPDGTSWDHTAKLITSCDQIITKLITSCDQIITVDTGVAHLAGALGKPMEIILPMPADWRWGPTGSRTTPLYPTANLRWAWDGDWVSAVKDAVNSVRSSKEILYA